VESRRPSRRMDEVVAEIVPNTQPASAVRHYRSLLLHTRTQIPRETRPPDSEIENPTPTPLRVGSSLNLLTRPP
jgi:hypothetical protein